MKRFIAAMLCAAAVFLTLAPVAAQAGASDQYAAPHWTTEKLKFRTHKAAIVGNEYTHYGVDLLGGYADSTTASRVGAQAAVLCTTTAIRTLGWPELPNQVAADSLTTFLFNVHDATGSGCQTGMDSLYVAIQGSVDNINWVVLRTFKNGTISTITSRLSQANVTGAFQGLLTMNGASLSNGPPVWRYPVRQRGLEGFEGVEVGGAARWPLLRFIVGFPDAGGYIVGASVTHLTTKDE